MAKEFLAPVGYTRQRYDLGWKKIGKLFWDGQKASLFLQGFRQGLCGAKPKMKDPPFLEGEIQIPVDTYKDKLVYLFVGSITTSETKDNSVIYSIRLECQPYVAIKGGGVWLDINMGMEDQTAGVLA